MVTTANSETITNGCAEAGNEACWDVCVTTTSTVDCNGGPGWQGKAVGGGAPPTYPIIANRIWAKIGQTSAPTLGAAAASHVFAYHDEILMAAFYHAHWGGSTKIADGTKWCSDFKTTLNVNGDANTATATNGLTGKSKCTWQFISAEGTKGPTLSLKKSDYVNYLFNWIEWLNVTGLGTAGVLTGNIAGDFKIGNYPTSEAVVHLNPLKTSTAVDSASAWLGQSAFTSVQAELDPSVRNPGSIGDAIYFPRQEGPFKADQTVKIDVPILTDIYAHFNAQYASYNSALDSYNNKKKTYNEALKNEKERRADFIRNYFEAAVEVPQRPCPPTQPIAYSGPALSLK